MDLTRSRPQSADVDMDLPRERRPVPQSHGRDARPGPGGVTLAIYSAAMMMPLLMLWGLVETLFRRVTGRRADPYGK